MDRHGHRTTGDDCFHHCTVSYKHNAGRIEKVKLQSSPRDMTALELGVEKLF